MGFNNNVFALLARLCLSSESKFSLVLANCRASFQRTAWTALCVNSVLRWNLKNSQVSCCIIRWLEDYIEFQFVRCKHWNIS